MHALPALLFSDEALMQLVGFNAQHVRQGVCQRGAATRQGERTPGPISPETLANNIVKLNLRDLEIMFNGAIRALARAKVFGAKVTGIADGTDLETTERYTGCGRVTRKRRIEDRHGREHEIEGRVLDLDFHCPVCHAATLFEGGIPWYSHQFFAPTVSASRW
jgi:hypothetical protein